jgi:hypothetical protein
VRGSLRAPLAAALATACAAAPPAGTPDIHDVTISPAGAFEASLAAVDDGMTVAWYDTRGGRAAIYMRQVDAAGRPRGAELRVTSGEQDAYEPDVASLSGAVVIGWYEKAADGHLTPRLAAWTRDGSERWVKTLAPSGRNTVVRARDGRIFSAWIQDEDAGRSGVWAAWWHDDGSLLVPPRRLADAGRTTWNLNAAIDSVRRDGPPRAWVVFDAAAGTTAEELFVVEADGATSRVTRVTADDGFASKYPDVAVLADRIALTWFDVKDGNEEVYLLVAPRANLGEDATAAAARVTNTMGHSIGAYVAWNADRVGLAWCDDTEGQNEIYFQAFDEHGAPRSTASRLTRTRQSSSIPAIGPWQAGFALAWSEHDLPTGDAHGVTGESRIALTLIP